MHQVHSRCVGRGQGGYHQRYTTTGNIFEAQEDGIKDQNGLTHIYSMTNLKETSNQFILTTEEISAFIRKKYNMGNHIKKAIEGMTNIKITRTRSPKPEDNGQIDTLYQ